MRAFICGLFLISNMSSAMATVAIVHGSDSIPSGERGYARSLASHVQRWYRGYGVECRLSDDRDLKTALANTRLAVLVYLSQPDAADLAVLHAFVRRGGKLIVFYSASDQLAQLMEMKCLGYQGYRSDGRWSSMRFSGANIPGLPKTVSQSSANLVGMAPLAGKSRVIAWWHDREGEPTDPAWLAGSHGYWMTHVLQADGDAAAKGRMLLALAATCDSSLWLPAAGSIFADVALIGRAGGADGLLQMAQSVKTADRRARALRAAQKLVAEERRVRALIKSGEGLNAFEAAVDFRSAAWNLYGIMQSPRSGEIRAVWDHSGLGLYPGNWELTCELLKYAGITDLYVNVAGSGFAYYDSKVLPRAAVLQQYGDQLQSCLKAARPHGLRVHAWLLCFSTERATPARMDIFKNKGWLTTLPEGKVSRWLDPRNSEVHTYLLEAVQEMAIRYEIAGVHLDFVRYPDFNSSLGNAARRQFENDTSLVVADWPADVKPGRKYHHRFASWRAKNISMFVSAARRTLRRDAPGTLLSTAVFGKYPSCFAAVGQDWVSWLDIDLVDYVTPMNYTSDLNAFSSWVEQQSVKRAHRLRVVPGIGVTANESRLNAAQVIDQINITRQAGCAGFALFDLDTTLRQEILPVLRMGATAP